MEHFEQVEADFQQYYGIDLERYYRTHIARHKGFARYMRLYSQLPPESRIVKTLSPVETWQWNDETLSLILQELRSLTTMTYNMNRKKGTKTLKVPDQFQPKYIKDAKAEMAKADAEQEEAKNEIDAGTRAFWEQRTGIKMN